MNKDVGFAGYNSSFVAFNAIVGIVGFFRIYMFGGVYDGEDLAELFHFRVEVFAVVVLDH